MSSLSYRGCEGLHHLFPNSLVFLSFPLTSWDLPCNIDEILSPFCSQAHLHQNDINNSYPIKWEQTCQCFRLAYTHVAVFFLCSCLWIDFIFNFLYSWILQYIGSKGKPLLGQGAHIVTRLSIKSLNLMLLLLLLDMFQSYPRIQKYRELYEMFIIFRDKLKMNLLPE